MADSTQEALDTPELLEAILLQLPARDLLFARRVSTTFRDAIDESIHIQRKLFLTSQSDRRDSLKSCHDEQEDEDGHETESEDEDGLKPESKGGDGISVLNPFLLRILRLHGIRDCEGHGGSSVHSNYIRGRGPEVDVKGAGDDVDSSELRRISTGSVITFFMQDINEGVFFKPRNKEQIYENMLVADPPVKIDFWDRWNDEHVVDSECNNITTIGKLLDSYMMYFPDYEMLLENSGYYDICERSKRED